MKVAATALVVLAVLAGPAAAAPERPPAFRVLAFTRTEGFRHDSIPAGVTALKELGARHRFAVRATEDPAAFRTRRLRRYDAVAFLSTTGDVLGRAAQRALARFVRGGGGWVGIHSAADTEYDWPFYGRLVGAYFRSHPPGTQPATVRVEDPGHPATRGLPLAWTRTDEWYDFRANPRPDVHVLATLDEATYTGGMMGADHPIAWCHRYRGGRAFYTALGHTSESYAEPEFRRHLLGGIRWAAGMAPGRCGT
jgi:type 1 glutamine amidotransferase